MTNYEAIKADFEPITQELIAFVRAFDEEYTCELGSDFEAVDDVKIMYAVAVLDYAAKSFYENFVQRFPACADFDIFVLSFMHELGHLETAWEMVDDCEEREIISAMNNIEKAYRKYYALYNETIATDWAGEYLTAHHEAMKTWEKKILSMFKKVLDKYPDV